MVNDVVEKVSRSSIITTIVRQVIDTMNSESASIETTIKVPREQVRVMREFGVPEDVAAFLEHDEITVKLPLNVATRIPVLLWNIKHF
jgi:4-hydroxy-3-methylbut-2-enyl diphosphate reductase IspH